MISEEPNLPLAVALTSKSRFPTETSNSEQAVFTTKTQLQKSFPKLQGLYECFVFFSAYDKTSLRYYESVLMFSKFFPPMVLCKHAALSNSLT